MTMTERSRAALEDAVWQAAEQDADYDDILSEVKYILNLMREDGELA